jgi:sugar lactone lactonase YvrE
MPTRTLASMPAGNFFENLWVDGDGSLLITSYLGREILRWRAAVGLTVEARIDGYPVSIASDSDGARYVAVHGQSFRAGAAVLESQRIVRLNADGSAETVLNAPQAKFFNGMAWLSPGRFLVADSLAGTIWLLDVTAKTLVPWLQHEDLQSSLPQRMVPGANGIHIVGDQVWISNSSRRLLMTVALLPDFTAGALQRRVEGLPIDDFALAADGSILAATHRQAVLRLRTDGKHEVIAESADVNDSTAVRFGRGADAGKAFVVTSGGAFAGRSETVQLVQLDTGTTAAAEREPRRRLSNLDMRLVLALKVSEEAAQKWLPAPWRVAPVTSGPAQGSNLSLIFVDRQQVLDETGALDRGGLERSMIVTVPARHPLTGESTTFPIRAYSTVAREVPGPYGTSATATIAREARVSGEPNGASTSSESWRVATPDGRSLELTASGRIGMPGRVAAHAALRSPTQPGFMRIYRIEQAVDWWRSAVPGSSDRVTALQLHSDIAELMPLLGNQPQVLSLAQIPWYQRQVFVP